ASRTGQGIHRPEVTHADVPARSAVVTEEVGLRSRLYGLRGRLPAVRAATGRPGNDAFRGEEAWIHRRRLASLGIRTGSTHAYITAPIQRDGQGRRSPPSVGRSQR